MSRQLLLLGAGVHPMAGNCTGHRSGPRLLLRRRCGGPFAQGQGPDALHGSAHFFETAGRAHPSRRELRNAASPRSYECRDYPRLAVAAQKLLPTAVDGLLLRVEIFDAAH